MRKNRGVSSWRVLVFSFEKNQYFCPQKFQRHQISSSTERLPNLCERSQYSEDLNTQDTGSEWTEKYIVVQAAEKGNTGPNCKALEINISSKAISFPQGDP